MSHIIFKRESPNTWRRDDGTTRMLIDCDDMIDEVLRLHINEGWKLVRHGVTHIRAIEIFKEQL